MTAFTLKIDTLEDARRAIDLYSRTGFDFRIPLVQSVIDGRICHFEAHRIGSSGKVKRFLAMSAGRPTLVLIGDDDGDDTGPDGWPMARRLLRWARVVVLHGTGAERWHYETTVNTAELHGQVLMVECSTATLPAWMEATRRWAPNAGVQVLRVPPGTPAHPTHSTPETVQ